MATPLTAVGTPAPAQPGRRVKSMTLAHKEEITEWLDNGERVVAVTCAFRVNESTLKTARKNQEKILQVFKDSAHDYIRHRRKATVDHGKMEKLLSQYLDQQTKKKMPVSSAMLCETTKVYYEKTRQCFFRQQKSTTKN
ncbi:hypothetical protein Hamer_G013126 [Homarus americanus]|uniref:Uncharacterized protein n=1 Tax=Homarus americanus TaxID=6706 RepID=A0A8J5K617_HOMAM|nr:hypothetical protein Hamer_G013126 [Homarus americanus]